MLSNVDAKKSAAYFFTVFDKLSIKQPKKKLHFQVRSKWMRFILAEYYTKNKLSQTVSSIRMVIIFITCWMCQGLSTIDYIAQNCLLTNKTKSIALRIFGIRPRDTCADSTVFQQGISAMFDGVRVAI
jgi:hypothetical protein